MAKQVLNQTRPPTKPRSSCSFLGCFGSSQDDDVSGIMDSANKAVGSRKRNRWLSWSSRLRVKSKTVPVVDAALLEKRDSLNKISAKSKSKSSTAKIKLKPLAEKLAAGKRLSPVGSPKTPSRTPAPEEETPKQQTMYGPAQDTVLEKRDTTNDTMVQKRRSFCRKIDTIRTGFSSQPGSPVDHKQPNKLSSTGGNIGFRRALSQPAATFPTAATNSSKPASPRPPVKNNKNATDPVVGMSIILVTLIIMLLWGRVCAILSTSAWFYFIPRLMKSINSSHDRDHTKKNNHKNGSIWEGPDLNYEVYKKRVVLEGFLERNHRCR